MFLINLLKGFQNPPKKKKMVKLSILQHLPITTGKDSSNHRNKNHRNHNKCKPSVKLKRNEHKFSVNSNRITIISNRFYKVIEDAVVEEITTGVKLIIMVHF